MINHKKAQMQMTMGTLVTIVLLTMVLILGGYFVSRIFTGATENIDGIDAAVKSEINKLFGEDSSKKIVIYPSTREIIIKKGEDSLGFGLSVRNVGDESAEFSYEIKAEEVSCNLQLLEAEDYIALGRTRSNIQIPAGSIMENPIFVRFELPETAPPCRIRYSINMKKGSDTYGSTVDVDLVIKAK
ncbi:hypothetical protein KAR52_01200 [Candidatus Pacearchaeota archaeon]|nr:hypothetical protein [Candidatus Pacearchaeota archaeon]